MSSSSNANQGNLWFSVSLGLMGFILGFAVAMVIGGNSTFMKFNAGGGGVPTAPTAPAADAGGGAPAIPVADRMAAIAADLDLDEDAFKTCTESTKFDAAIKAQMAAGSTAGISGTPGNILFDTQTNTAWAITGARPFESFKTSIDDMMKNPTGKPSDTTVEVITAAVEKVNAATDHIRGNKNARFAIIEYSDLQCPFCQRVHGTMQQIQDEYGDDVMWVYRHFPLDFHPEAMPLARGAECAKELGGSDDYFWQFVDKVFAV